VIVVLPFFQVAPHSLRACLVVRSHHVDAIVVALSQVHRAVVDGVEDPQGEPGVTEELHYGDTLLGVHLQHGSDEAAAFLRQKSRLFVPPVLKKKKECVLKTARQK
jgi:hypothetical protein